MGRGKGIATYYNREFHHVRNINCDGFSLTKFESDKLDVIGVYRSQEGNVTRLITELKLLVKEEKTTVIGGDLNICVLAHTKFKRNGVHTTGDQVHTHRRRLIRPSLLI